MAAQGPVVPKQLNYADVLPVAIESRSNKRTFEPTNGNTFSYNGNQVIRMNINSDNLCDFTHSYMQATLTNTSAKTLVLDTGVPWISRVQILSGGQELENIDAYNRIHSMLEAVQGNPNQAGEQSLTHNGKFPDLAAAAADTDVLPTITSGAGDAADVFASTINDGGNVVKATIDATIVAAVQKVADKVDLSNAEIDAYLNYLRDNICGEM
eukprot:SAG22_NODE_4354_length_1293_cov_6.915410_1_plen_210_part_10